MTFKKKLSNTYRQTVTLEIIGEDGQVEKNSFEVEFARLTRKQLKDLTARINSGELTDEKFLLEVMKGWSGVLDDADKEMPFNAQNLNDRCEVIEFVPGVINTFYKSIQGVREKN